MHNAGQRWRVHKNRNALPDAYTAGLYPDNG